jgi:DNA invertase Pin-like site-specific DNA recombinase
LLVESLDRLSRQEVRKSLTLLLQIIDSGIVLVTLADGRIFRHAWDINDRINLCLQMVTGCIAERLVILDEPVPHDG